MLIDAHTHIDRYDLIDPQTSASAIAEIEQERIFTISNSIDLPSYKRNLEIGRACGWVLPTFGIHPWNAPEYVDRLDDLVVSTEQSPMIGEIGLDYALVKDTSTFPAQRKVFKFFLEAARRQDKIVSLHMPGAENDSLRFLQKYGITRGIVHWYSGPLDILQKLADRGMYFSVGVEVLYSEHIREVARAVPVARLLTETDNPGGPHSVTGTHGRPALVKDIIQGIARARNISFDAVVDTVQANMLELMRGDSHLVTVRQRLE
jgi:TatD DNase family protein